MTTNRTFFSVALPVGFVCAMISTLLDLGENATFAVTMGPLITIMIAFMLRDRAHDARMANVDHSGRPSHRGA